MTSATMARRSDPCHSTEMTPGTAFSPEAKLLVVANEKLSVEVLTAAAFAPTVNTDAAKTGVFGPHDSDGDRSRS